jgi:hypothetical protein
MCSVTDEYSPALAPCLELRQIVDLPDADLSRSTGGTRIRLGAIQRWIGFAHARAFFQKGAKFSYALTSESTLPLLVHFSVVGSVKDESAGHMNSAWRVAKEVIARTHIRNGVQDRPVANRIGDQLAVLSCHHVHDRREAPVHDQWVVHVLEILNMK